MTEASGWWGVAGGFLGGGLEGDGLGEGCIVVPCDTLLYPMVLCGILWYTVIHCGTP